MGSGDSESLVLTPEFAHTTSNTVRKVSVKPRNRVWLLQRLGGNGSVAAVYVSAGWAWLHPVGFPCGSEGQCPGRATAGKRELWAHQALILGIRASNNCHFLELKAHPPLTLLGVRV